MQDKYEIFNNKNNNDIILKRGENDRFKTLYQKMIKK